MPQNREKHTLFCGVLRARVIAFVRVCVCVCVTALMPPLCARPLFTYRFVSELAGKPEIRTLDDIGIVAQVSHACIAPATNPSPYRACRLIMVEIYIAVLLDHNPVQTDRTFEE